MLYQTELHSDEKILNGFRQILNYLQYNRSLTSLSPVGFEPTCSDTEIGSNYQHWMLTAHFHLKFREDGGTRTRDHHSSFSKTNFKYSDFFSFDKFLNSLHLTLSIQVHPFSKSFWVLTLSCSTIRLST